MIVECGSEGVQLLEPFDFRRFKLVLRGNACIEACFQHGITFTDDHNALVSIDVVPALRGCPDDGNWQTAFSEMVAKAREHGWIDADKNAIRAHVELRS